MYAHRLIELGHFDLVKDASLKWYDSFAIAKHVFRGDCGTSLFYQLYFASLIVIPPGMFDYSGSSKLLGRFMGQAERHEVQAM